MANQFELDYHNASDWSAYSDYLLHTPLNVFHIWLDVTWRIRLPPSEQDHIVMEKFDWRPLKFSFAKRKKAVGGGCDC